MVLKQKKNVYNYIEHWYGSSKLNVAFSERGIKADKTGETGFLVGGKLCRRVGR